MNWKFLVLLASLAVTFSSGEEINPQSDWPWWRGPARSNHAAAGSDPVVTFSQTENVVWKVPVSGRGHASPTIVGNRIFLATADADAEIQSVLAFDRSTGEPLWSSSVNEGNFPEKIHRKNTHASSTVACDGERVVAVFNNRDALHVVALSVTDGELLWEKRLGPYAPKRYEFGFAASPLVYGNTVIVLGDTEFGGFLTALDRRTGKQVWSVERPKQMNYSSPILATVGGVAQVLISGCSRLSAYDPKTGKALWVSMGASSDVTCGTVVWGDDLVFASGGFPEKLTAAVRSGTGEIVWQNKKKSYEQSMLVHDKHLYTVNDNGIAFCWNAKDGEERWSERLKGPVSASPVLAGGRLYAANEAGTFFVYRADPEKFELLAKNQLGDEAFATPTILGTRIYARVTHLDDEGERQEMLYCLGKKSLPQ